MHMTPIRALGLLLLALPVAGESPAPRQVRQYTIDQLLSTTSYSGAPNAAQPMGGYADTFSPDGSKILVSSNQTGVFNAYAIPVDGGPPVQLTDSKVNAVQVIGYFPRDERFLYLSDQGGNELTHLYVRSPDGQVRDLTPGEKVRAEFLDWAPDGRAFFFTTNERDPNLFDVYEMALDGYGRKLLFTNPGEFLPLGVSPDRRHVALGKAQGTSDNDIHLHDRTTGKTVLLTPGDQHVDNAFQAFSPDGASLYYTTDQEAEFKRLMRYAMATGKREEVLRPRWDVVAADFSRSGKHLVVAVNDDARTQVSAFEAAGMRPVEVPRVPDALVTDLEFSPDGRWLAFYAEAGNTPPNLYVRDLKTGKDRQLTRSLGPEIDPANLVSGEVVRFKSYDGLDIPGILYKPHQASPGSRVPAIVKVHGGPGGQATPAYAAM